MIGLKRGTVILCDHESQWENIASDTIAELIELFGDKAVDIQHIGSTAIRNIKAKPIIDIVVGVENFEDLSDVLIALTRNGFKESYNRFSSDLLYVIETDDGIRTHQIHILIYGSLQWHNYVDFRDYMHAFPEKATTYEQLKIKLTLDCDNVQIAYTDGKKNYMDMVLFDSRVFTQIKQRYAITAFDPISKGWSSDKKYCIVTADTTKYLLRVTPKAKVTNRADMFRMQQELAALGVSMCKPIEFGTCDEGGYIVQTWVEGKDAEEVKPYLSDSEQYAYGLEAGRTLKLIHSIKAPANQPDWELRFNAKMDRKIKMYEECPIKFDGAEDIIDYIKSNRHLLANRPQSFQHGDHHIGNMMIENGKIVIIDFDRYNFGDPWEEFNRIVWCAQSSPLFASGMVNGYFDNEVPIEFWKLLALYISSNMLSSIPWAIPYGEGEVNTMLNQAKDVLSWYNNMKNIIPTWYFK